MQCRKSGGLRRERGGSEVDLRGVRPGAAIRYAVHAGVAAVSEKQRHGWIMFAMGVCVGVAVMATVNAGPWLLTH